MECSTLSVSAAEPEPDDEMAHADFVHLRVHSAYSLLEGAISVNDLVRLCCDQAMPAIAVTDSANMFGALEFSMACAAAGIQPVIGTILNVSQAAPPAANGRRETPDRLLLLAQDESGYANLLKLSSRSFLHSDRLDLPQVAAADLAGHADGLIALSGGLEGPVARRLREGQKQAAEGALLELARIFPGRLYVELQRHGLPDEQRIEPDLLDLAYRHDLPLVATNDVYFASEDMFAAHDVLICVAEGAYASQSDRRRLTPEHRFKSAAEMRALFADLPEAVDNTLVVAQRSAYRPRVREPILPRFETPVGRDEAGELTAEAQAGLGERLENRVFTEDMDGAARDAVAAPYRERLADELEVIIGMNYPGYFLVVADFIRFAKQSGIPVGPGRGSGAASVVAWSLSITDLDPLRFGLVFERFLNPHRVSMPDFDIDFCQEKRDQVIRYVQDKYGRDRVAQIITFGTLQARAALRDVGRVLEMPYGQVDRLCKLVPYNPANPVTLNQAIAAEPRLAERRDADGAVARLLEIAARLEGLYRHASTHAAGLVIGDRPLDELIPLYRDPRSDMPVTQFSMKYAELSGLIKFDFLGLKTLTVLDRACRLVARRGVDLDLGAIALDDAKTYDLLTRGDTVGIFQFESSGMRDLLREARPDHFEDVIALVALFRPGPMENIPKYVACKHGREAPEFLHELIEPVVADTYGVIIYQEQVMRIAQVFAGFSMGEADLLRRAMGKKIKSEMEAQRDSFVAGATAKGVPTERAIHVFNLVDKFAGYGFNKAHSAGYALLAYQTAWMKANYPVEFLAASMTLDLGNTDKIAAFKRELERQGVELRHPDINRSGVEFTVEAAEDGRQTVRYALSAIRNVGRAAMEALVSERDERGPFTDLADFAERLDHRTINRRQLENLARAGAFDSLNANRAQVLAAVETLIGLASAATEERESQQVSLFGGGDRGADSLRLPAADPWHGLEKLRHERDALGFHLSAHPLDGYRRVLARLNVRSAADALQALNGDVRRLCLAGAVESVSERTSQRGNRFARVSLSDTSDTYEVIVFAEQLAAARELLEPGARLLVDVDASLEGEVPRFTAQAIRALDAVAGNLDTGLVIALDDRAPVPELARVLSAAPSGRGPIRLALRVDDETEVALALPERFVISPELRARISELPGVLEVEEV